MTTPESDAPPAPPAAEPPSPARWDIRLVPAALAAWAVTAAGIATGIGYWLAALSAVVALACWVIARRFGPRHPLLAVVAGSAVCAAVVGTGFGVAIGLRCEAVAHHPITHRFGSTAWVTVTATESPHSAGPSRLMFRGNLAGLGDREIGGPVVVFGKAIDFGQVGAGQPVRFRSRVSRPTRRDLSVAVITVVGRPELGGASLPQRVAQAIRDRFAAHARAVMPADQAAILPGLVLGDTSAVSAATTADFRIAGLTHLTAVSGANVSIICAAVLLSAYLIGPRPAVALAALALVGFVVVVQPSASVLRASVMAGIGLVAVLTGRRRQVIPVLAGTVIGLLLVAPQLAVDLGFALSVSATAALVVLAPVWSARLVVRGWPKPLADALCVALAAHLVTAPLIAAISGRFSLVSVLANLAVAVVIPPITVFGTAAAAVGCLWPPGAGMLIRFAAPETWWLLKVAYLAGRLPGAAIEVPSGWAGVTTVGGTGVAAAVLWRRRWFRLAAGAAGLCVAAWSVSGLVGGT